MVSASEGPLLRKFKVIGIAGIFAIPLAGALIAGATGWSPWVTYGVPLLILILVTLPLLSAARRQHAEMRNASSRPKDEP